VTRRRAIALDTLRAIAVVVGVSVVVGAAESVSHVSNISNLYIIAIALLTTWRGMYPAVVASALAFLAFDWFFVPPVHQFTVNDPSEWVALTTLVVTIIVIGHLLSLARRRAEQSRSFQRQAELLYEVGQSALSSHQVANIYPLALWRLNETLGLTGSRLLVKDGNRFRQVAASGNVDTWTEEASWLQRIGDDAQVFAIWRQPANNVHIVTELQGAPAAVAAPDGARLSHIYLPLRIEDTVAGVLVVGAPGDGRSLSLEDRRLLLAFANQLAIAAQRESFAEQEARARALEESDRLKSALLSSVSHELKTPLAAIKASVTAMMHATSGTEVPVRAELAGSINRETDRLTRLVSNLLDVSRLEAGALHPQREWVSMVDVVADVLDRMEPVLDGRAVTTDIPEALPATEMDFVQISQVLTNLLENAARYAPPRAAISISADVVRDQLRVTVFNEGTHIPPEDLDRLFEKFHRLSTASGGVGLGLSIARGMVQAHGGHIWAENVGRRGVAFTFTVPSPVRPTISPSPASPAASVA